MKKIFLALFLVSAFFAFLSSHSPVCAIQEDGSNEDGQKIPWAAYMSKVEKTIKANWKPPREKEPAFVKVSFRVDKNGDLTVEKILESSGSEKMNESAKLAIEKSSPMPPLPQEYKDDSINIEFTFDYKVIGDRPFGASSANPVKDAKSDAVPKDDKVSFYTRAIEQAIIKNWNPPKRKAPYEVAVKCKIQKDGTLASAKIIKSSGDSIIDKTYLEAVEKAAPFAPLPEEYKKEQMEVDFSASYRVNQYFAVAKVVKGKTYNNTLAKLPDEQSQKEYKKYMKTVEKELAAIVLDEYSPAKSIILSFDIEKNGSVKNINIITSSGSKTFDSLASAKVWYINFPKITFSKNLETVPVICEIKSGKSPASNYPLANALNLSSMALLIMAIVF